MTLIFSVLRLQNKYLSLHETDFWHSELVIFVELQSRQTEKK